ncbi:tetratricopeptide repeat protein [Brevibacillus fulvus]|uniref:Tetratricopeptide (TPR) repeat protein n=1 Tax=Brevibacillus fulvus TaxID=1125967 RepID=A0A939BNB1_9BACL|nr:tetratricopeptide repeat protein [Brevibacillus fulvus]MBM7588750.1 tetratricopeptide (TPR) repeat protein [Brevibacillus fulvus]
MQLEEWFDSLHKKLDAIEQEWPNATRNEKLTLANQLFQLRGISDKLVDSWLQFEEKLSGLITTIKHQENASPTASQPDGHEFPPTTNGLPAEEDFQLDTYSHMFRKGEGYYHLRLFQDAKQCFSDLLQESPDWEEGRLYYAYSLFFCGETEAALREFRLLSRSGSSPKTIAISYNAIGCMLAEEGQWLEASQAFRSALAEKSDHREALFNLALCYLQEGEAQESYATAERYLQLYPADREAQILLLQAARKLRQLNRRAEIILPEGLMVPSKEHDPQTLREIALFLESSGEYHRAQFCYQLITEQQPREGWGWHGLAWTTWLISGTRRALQQMKKAIALAPDNLDFLFSYGWMVLFDGDRERAAKTFDFILQKNPRHYLARCGVVTVLAINGDLASAKQIARGFLEDADPYVQSLGYFQLGKLSVLEEKWEQADQYFRKIHPDHRPSQELPVYLQLCAQKMGKPMEAEQLIPYTV